MIKTYLIKSTNSKANRDKMVLVDLESSKVVDYIKRNYDINFYWGSNNIFVSATEVKVVDEDYGTVKFFEVNDSDYFYTKAKSLFEYKLVKGKCHADPLWISHFTKCKNGTIKDGRVIAFDEYLVENFI